MRTLARSATLRTLGGLAVAAALSMPAAVAAPIPRVLVVGPLDSYGGLVAGVSEGLQAGGFSDAAQIRVDVGNASSLDEAKAIIAAAVQEGVDAIVAVFGQVTQAAHQLAPSIPVIFCPVADPVASKLVASLQEPGGHLTGIASADAEATRRRLASFAEVVPGLKRLAVLFDQGFPPDRVQVAHLEQVGPAHGVTIVKREAPDAAAAIAALEALSRADVDAVFFLKESLLRRVGQDIGAAAAARRLPLLVGDPDLVTLPGVVASVGPNQRETGRLGGELAAKVLKGASPARLPVQHPPFEMIVNLKAAADVGLEVPEPAVKHAVRVIR